MALDRFICWNKEKPTLAQVRQLLEDFLSGAGKIDSKNDNWFIITLPGKPQWMFKSICPDMAMAQSEAWPHCERWFEVCCIDIDSNIDVMTRQSDHFTNTVAECFAKAIAKFYRARYDDPGEIIDYGEK